MCNHPTGNGFSIRLLFVLLLFMVSAFALQAGELKQILFGKTRLADSSGNSNTNFKLGDGGVITFEDNTEVSFWVAPSYKKVFSTDAFSTKLANLKPLAECSIIHIDAARPYNIQNRRYQTFLFMARCPDSDLSGIFVNYVPAVGNHAIVFFSKHQGEAKPIMPLLQRLRLHKKP